ncbi:MAG: hypothetical protein ACYDCM_05590 [Candidatus Acidiferrales bacterium]
MIFGILTKIRTFALQRWKSAVVTPKVATASGYLYDQVEDALRVTVLKKEVGSRLRFVCGAGAIQSRYA